MRPAPGWCIVQTVATEERFGGSRIIVPQQTRDWMSRNQVEILQVGGALHCEEDDCWCDGTHPAPPRLTPGSWAIVRPRSKHPIPREHSMFLVPTSEIVAVIF